MMGEEKLVMTWKEYREALDRAFERGYKDGYLRGQEGGLKIAKEAMERSTQPIIMDRVPFTNEEGEL